MPSILSETWPRKKKQTITILKIYILCASSDFISARPDCIRQEYFDLAENRLFCFWNKTEDKCGID